MRDRDAVIRRLYLAGVTDPKRLISRTSGRCPGVIRAEEARFSARFRPSALPGVIAARP